MSEVAPWLTLLVEAALPVITIVGCWIALSARVTKAEILSGEANIIAKEASERATLLSAAFGVYREKVAQEYIHREAMREVEDRLTQAIDRLGDRLDKFLFRSKAPNE